MSSWWQWTASASHCLRSNRHLFPCLILLLYVTCLPLWLARFFKLLQTNSLEKKSMKLGNEIAVANRTLLLVCHNETNKDEMKEANASAINNETVVRADSVYSCCARLVTSMENPYFPYSRNTPTVEDRLSPVDMEFASDFHYGTNRVPGYARQRIIDLNSSNLPCLLDGAVIYVSTWSLRDFLQLMLPNITTKFVLVTGDTDGSMPASLHMHHDEVMTFLQDGRLLHWYAENCNKNPDPLRFTCLPKGMSIWASQRWDMQVAYERGHGLQGLELDFLSLEKNITLLASFFAARNEGRQLLWNMACKPEGLLYNITLCDYNKRSSLHRLYNQVARSKFVLSPHGYGLDCYRTYEALYLGAIPVVKNSSLDEMYKDLPVLILNDWEELANDGFLEQKYQEIAARNNSFRWEKMYMGYWFAKLRSHYPAFYQFSIGSNLSSSIII